MIIEEVLQRLSENRNLLINLYKEQGVYSSGLLEWDKKIGLLDPKKKYFLIAPEGNALKTFYQTIYRNLKDLYIDIVPEEFFEYKYYKTNITEPIRMKHLKALPIDQYDVVVSIYRPEYYGLTEYNSQKELSNIVFFEVLKSQSNFYCIGAVYLNSLLHRVQSVDKN